jgi:hypothetical protein
MTATLAVLACFGLYAVGCCITAIALWLVVEAGLALRRYRREGRTESPDLDVG